MKQSNNINVALYCRAENAMDEPYAIRNQEKKLYAFAKDNGYLPCAVYSDNIYSDISPERPAFQRLLRDILAGKITHIVVKDVTRLFRDIAQFHWFFDLCDHRGIIIVSLEQGGTMK